MSRTDHGFEPFAEYCGVESVEVLNWIGSGQLVASQMCGGGYRITVGDFLTFFSRYTFLI